MRNLPRPGRDLVRDHLTIALEVHERNGQLHGYPVTEGDLDTVIALYDAYDEADGSPGDPLKALHLDEALRIAIQTGYDLTQTGRRLASIRSGLMQGVEQCPVCGISPPRALDHHLPKASYHALSIYVRNLVPLCADCNQSKGAAAPENPAERFVHPYFEALPEVHFLTAAVTIDNGALNAEFGIDPEAALPPLLAARLDHQLRRLRLNARYAQELNAYLAGHTTGIDLCHEALGADGVRTYLDRQAAVEFHRFHRNHWRPTLLLALAGHDAFCDGAFRELLPVARPGALIDAAAGQDAAVVA